MNLYHAERIAKRFLERLAPAIDQGEIGGAIRRRQPTVIAVELVVIPKTAPALTLFDTGERRSLLEPVLQAIVGDRVRYDEHTKRNGDRLKRFIVDGIPINLSIILPPAQFGVMLANRTGPDEFWRWLVNARESGGRMPPGHQTAGGALYRHGRMIPTPTEQDFFREIGRQWIAPEYRMDYAPFAKEARGPRVFQP